MPGAIQFVEEAMTDGLVLVHSLMEVRACTIACACCAYRISLWICLAYHQLILTVHSDEATQSCT